MALEPMRRRDLPEVVVIERASFPDPWSLEQFQGELRLPFARARVLRERPGETMVGYACWRLFPSGRGDCDLMNIAVRADRRGRGLARRLLEAVLRSARRAGAERVVLEVRDGNEAAIALYRSLGFQPVGRRRRYYEGKADALIMARALEPDRPRGRRSPS